MRILKIMLLIVLGVWLLVGSLFTVKYFTVDKELIDSLQNTIILQRDSLERISDRLRAMESENSVSDPAINEEDTDAVGSNVTESDETDNADKEAEARAAKEQRKAAENTAYNELKARLRAIPVGPASDVAFRARRIINHYMPELSDKDRAWLMKYIMNADDASATAAVRATRNGDRHSF